MTRPLSVQKKPGMPVPLTGSEGPPSLTMAALSAAILAWRVGSVVVMRGLQILEVGSDRARLAGRDAGRGEVGHQVGSGITAGGSARRPAGVQGLHLGWGQLGKRLPDDVLIGLDRRCQARRNLGLECLLVGVKGLEIGLKLGA